VRNRHLWERIAAYPLPEDASGRTFAEQLMREHRIGAATAERGIEEYRRFLYLSALGEGRAVPSRAVDAVWHLHLTHTRDYWQRFVPEVLDGRAIHHEPGSPAGHADDFRDTIRRYEREFGEAPPKGIWKRAGRAGGYLVIAFGTVFAGLWVTAAVAAAQPLIALPGLLFGGLAIWAGLGQAAPGLGIGFSVDIWADGSGGDCGDGGGCGD
jgi:hypothetical protein